MIYKLTPQPNPFAEAAAGRAPEFIEMMQVGRIRSSDPARLWGR
jgi:hypothetical protein